ncbi:DUF2062 domain-containing protein [Paenibacillus dakarensis]|uniref:DUF2062 domain-containing protein n=1 Tax=Paenibacillus dakarensis TaxID=1527293 RepID=UPI0006D55FA3|nr:DUF2062 domain-containing protein [Paenibacillus dakarensis]
MLRRLLRTLKYYTLTLLRMQNSDHRISLGFAAGFFPCWYPTFGGDIILAIALSRVIGGNMVAAVLIASIGSFLWPLLFYINYKIGFLISHIFSSPPPVDLQDVIHTPIPERNYSVLASYFSKLGDMGVNFLIGSAVNSILFSFIMYFVVRHLLSYYRTPLLIKIKKTSKNRVS